MIFLKKLIIKFQNLKFNLNNIKNIKNICLVYTKINIKNVCLNHIWY
jgi:hypothetical protein